MQHNNPLGTAGFIDVETTGFGPKTNEIIELALILFTYNRATGQIVKIIDEYCGLREPSCPISRGAMMIHGITKKALRGMRLDHNRIVNMLEKAEFLIAHNAAFDRGFVERLFYISALKPWYCSMSDIDWKGKGFSSRSLQNLLTAHGIKTSRVHRAYEDAKASLKLLSCTNENGETYLMELLKSRIFERVFSLV